MLICPYLWHYCGDFVGVAAVGQVKYEGVLEEVVIVVVVEVVVVGVP